jgi:uncharacterized protein (DUF849 family)
MNYAKYPESREDFLFNIVFENSFGDIREFIRQVSTANVQPKLECFDTGQIAHTHSLLNSGELEQIVQFSVILGVLGGIPARVKNLVHQVREFPEDANWQVIGIEEDQWPLVAAALSIGGHVRVSLEDNFYLPSGEISSNREQVAEAAELARDVGRERATPDKAMKIMGVV